MSAKVLFACSKCFSRHPFEELSSGQQLCKSCRGSTSVVKCTYCRSEFQPSSKSQSACKKCEHNLNKYGKPNACECCKIVAAFGGPKCMRCASYEAKYGPPVQCDECKQRSAFDKHDENKKVNGKLLCWLCTSAFKRALIKAQQEGRISSKKRPHEKSLRDGSGHSKKSSRSSATDASKAAGGNSSLAASGNMTAANATSASNAAVLDFPDKISRAGGANAAGAGGGANSNSGNGPMTVAAPALVTIDPNSTDHMVAMTNLKERIASLEKRLQQKDKELLEKEKLLTELKGKNFEKENEMRNKLKDIARLNEMRIENLNRKVASLLKEIAGLKKSNKKNGNGGGGGGGGRDKERKDRNIENVSPKEESRDAFDAKDEKDEKTDVQKRINDIRDDKDESNSVGGSSSSSSPSIN